MTIQQKFGGIAAFVILGLMAFGGYELSQEHDARLKAETSAAQQQKSIDAAKADAARAADQLQATLKTLEAEKAKPATPQQIVIDASKIIPNLPQPITIEQIPQSPGLAESNLPNAPAAQQIVIPPADYQAIHDAMIGCQENAAKLTACDTTNGALKKELAETQLQRDDYKTALKGGTFWHRVKSDAIKIGIAGTIGYLAGHKW